MRVCVTLEHRFDRTPDGAIWTGSNHSYSELCRYLGVFDEVRILARLRDVARPPEAGHRADGNAVSFWPLPYYLGFEQFCRRIASVRRAAAAGIGEKDAVILKAPSTLSSLVKFSLRGRPFAVELIGDPWDLYSKGAIRHPLRPVFRRCFTHLTKMQCEQACAVAYVTERLRERYPGHPGAFLAGISDVLIAEHFFAAEARRAPRQTPLRIVTVGTLANLCKGTDVLIEALSQSVNGGMDVCLAVVGDGKYRHDLATQADRLGVGNRVEFTGAIPAGERVFAELDRSDLFILPSRSEGLPRAMIEAMARGLPCIGSAVGGIPELLVQEDLVPPGDASALANKIAEVGQSAARMEQMSQRCLLRAHQFSEASLTPRTSEFFLFVREETQDWLKSRHSPWQRLAA
jgi:glycosyltransferase involved in cell wall biosynthesis